MSRTPKIICIALAIVFIVIAAFQFDQPDFELWISIYFVASFIAVMVAFDQLSKSVVIAAMIAFFVGAVAQWPAEYEGFTNGGIYAEQACESAGLFFCFASMSYFVFLVVKKRSRNQA